MKQKTLPAFILFILLGCTLNAQIQKGSVLLGGSFGYKSTDYYMFNTTANANINPRISYAIGNNSVIGLSGNFSYSRAKQKSSDDKITNTGYGASVFWRRYFPIQNKLGWYTELNGGIGGATEKRQVLGGDQKTNTTNYAVGAVPGIYFQALPRLLISANIGGLEYYHTRSKGTGIPDDNKYSSFSVNFLNAFYFGVDFILGKKS